MGIRPSTEFSTVAVDGDDNFFFQSFMAAMPCHPVLRRNVDLLIETYKFEGRDVRRTTPVSKLLGPTTLKRAYDETKPSHVQLFREVPVDKLPRALPDRSGFRCKHFAVYDPDTNSV